MAVCLALRQQAEACTLEQARSELASFQLSPLGERYPSVVQLWGEALARFEPLFALPEPVRQLVRSADRTAMEVHERLTRAIHRHGPFSDSAAALDFVEDALLRAERSLDRQWAAAMAGEAWGPMLPHRVLPARAAVSAPMLS
jgi:transposase-like protein